MRILLLLSLIVILSGCTNHQVSYEPRIIIKGTGIQLPVHVQESDLKGLTIGKQL